MAEKDVDRQIHETTPAIGSGCVFKATRRESGSFNYHSTSLTYSVEIQCSLENLLNGTAESMALGILHGHQFDEVYMAQYKELTELAKTAGKS